MSKELFTWTKGIRFEFKREHVSPFSFLKKWFLPCESSVQVIDTAIVIAECYIAPPAVNTVHPFHQTDDLRYIAYDIYSVVVAYNTLSSLKTGNSYSTGFF